MNRKKKLLSLDNLYDFFNRRGETIKFNSAETGTDIVVQVMGGIQFSKDTKAEEGLIPVELVACHTGRNRNKSAISKSVMSKSLSSFKNRPILAYIHTPKDEEEFGWHAMHEDEDGNVVYDEKIVGVVPESCKASLEYDTEKQRYYVHTLGYLYEEYSHAPQILKRLGEASVSVELNVRELSYDSNNKVLNIEDFFLSGITILGRDEDNEIVEAGMEGSNIKLLDFSKEQNSLFNLNTDLLAAIEKLNDTISAFNIKSFEKGGESQMNKFDELLQKYNKTLEDIDFEYEGMSDEELEVKFEELFGEASIVDEGENEIDPPTEDFEQEESDNEEENNDEAEDDADDESEDESTDNEMEFEGSDTASENEEDNSSEEEVENHIFEYAVNKMNFKVSLNDIQYALTVLVNDTYSESDNTYYSCIVYDDCVVMVDSWTGTAYRQSYKVRKGVYALTGDRIPVHAVYLTDDEESRLDNMKSSYAVMEKELDNYHNAEAFSEKIEIVSKNEFACLKGQKDFDDFVSEINDEKKHLKYSVQDVQNKCDELLLAYVKAGGQVNFEAQENKISKPTLFKLPTKQVKKSRYGNLFKQ